MVWEQARKAANRFLWSDRKILAGNIVLAVSSGFATTRLLDYWSKTVAIPPIIQLLAILLGTIIGFAILYFFNLGWNGLWEIPAKLYRGKEEDVALMSLDGVDAEPYPFMVHGTRVMGLKIYNKKPIDIYDVEIQIAEIWLDGVKSESEFLVLAFGEGDRFMSTFRRDVIGATKDDVVSVAQIVKGGA